VSGRLVAWLGFVGILTILAYAARAAAGPPEKNVVYDYGLAITGLVQYAIVLGVVLLIARGRFELLALNRPRSWATALGLSLALLIGIYVFVAILDQFLRAGEEQGLTPSGWQPDRAAAFAVNFAVIVGVAPFVEELTFRGLGYSLLEHLGRWTAIFVIGLTFGLVHGLIEGLPILAAFGATLAYLRARTVSVYPPVALHAAFNAIALIVSVSV
jgi:membrane protease YdiL (CAAX protease family)